MWNYTKTYLLLTACSAIVGGVAEILFDAGSAFGRAVGMLVFGTPFVILADVIATARHRRRENRAAMGEPRSLRPR